MRPSLVRVLLLAALAQVSLVAACEKDTGGICRWQSCSDSRGPTQCSNDHKCLCQDNYCSHDGHCRIEAPVTSAELCAEKTEDYSRMNICADSHIQAWQSVMNRGDQGGCVTLENGMIDCSIESRCEGSETVDQNITNEWRAITYNCSVCDDQGEDGVLLRIPCCEQCSINAMKAQDGQFTIGGNMINQVFCEGCVTEELEQLALQNLDKCTVTDGAFSCTVEAQCQTGAPEFEDLSYSYTCVEAPCGNCADESLRAECCHECLKATCKPWLNETGNTDPRSVCTGCDLLPSANVVSAAPPPLAWGIGSIALFSLIA